GESPPTAPGSAPPPPPPPPVTTPVRFGEVVITPVAHPSGNARHPGEAGHGYVEYRFRVENRSDTEAHRVTLILPRWRSGSRPGPYLQADRRTVEVGPRGSVPVSLWQPDVPLNNSDI